MLIVAVGIQAIRIDKTNPPVEASKDIMATTPTSIEVGTILRTSCYDCHSNATTYPWYTNLAPVSWFAKNHINEGRSELNFSEWADYSAEKKKHKIDECIEEINESEMPISSYLWMHSNAALTEEQKQTLINWFSSIQVK